MDKDDAIRMSRQYIAKVKQSGIEVIDAWLFGSYAKGDYHLDSDIDLAIILPDNQISFDTDVFLMSMRQNEETIIETHTYSRSDFHDSAPVISQIKRYGLKI